MINLMVHLRIIYLCEYAYDLAKKNLTPLLIHPCAEKCVTMPKRK